MTNSEPSTLLDFSSESFIEIGKTPDPSQMSIMPVVAVKGEEVRPVGTCFAISNHGMVLTARHVIDDALGLINGQPSDKKQWIGVVYMAKPTPDDETKDLVGGILPVNKIHFNPELDIAAMHLNLPTNTNTSKSLRMPCSVLGTGFPDVGESCIGIGYHLMDWEPANDGFHDYNVAQSFSATSGEIKKVYVPRRDSVSLSFPCFETSARYDGGMSGGPVINQKGSVIGVICSSFGDPEGEGHISYASLVGPALLIAVDTDVGNGVTEKRFLYDFINRGSVKSDSSINSIEVQRHEDALQIKFDDNFTMINNLAD